HIKRNLAGETHRIGEAYLFDVSEEIHIAYHDDTIGDRVEVKGICCDRNQIGHVTPAGGYFRPKADQASGEIETPLPGRPAVMNPYRAAIRVREVHFVYDRVVRKYSHGWETDQSIEVRVWRQDVRWRQRTVTAVIPPEATRIGGGMAEVPNREF